MSKIRQYRPNFVTGYDNADVEFNTLEELLNIDFVKNFSAHDTFLRYSISKDDYKDEDTLMAEYEGGYEWYVVGFIATDKELDLPIWKEKYKE